VSCNNATISNRQLTGGILTLWLIGPPGVTKEQSDKKVKIDRISLVPAATKDKGAK